MVVTRIVTTVVGHYYRQCQKLEWIAGQNKHPTADGDIQVFKKGVYGGTCRIAGARDETETLPRNTTAVPHRGAWENPR